MKSSILLGLLLTALLSINSVSKHEINKVGRPGPHAIVYKTKADYSKNVPINLSEDKTKIVSYPAPQDLFYQGKLATPTALIHGYLLDNRGIMPSSVFLKITYEEYSNLKVQPTEAELMNMIIDKNPFTEMYDLGSKATLDEKEINTIIKKHKLKTYQKLI
jgi:hypothetical protein